MVAVAGAYTPPHQDSNGLGSTLYCAYGYKAFLLCYNAGTPISLFSHIKEDIELGWEYMYYSPHRFGSFILCPGQTL